MKRSETIHGNEAEGKDERRRLWAAVAELEKLRQASGANSFMP